MNRRNVWSLSALLLTLSFNANAQNIRVRVNGERVRFQGAHPRQINGRVMVPLRGVLEQMGAYVDWLPESQTVVATRGNTEINLPIGSHTARINGRSVALDVPAMMIAGSTMVPLRFVSEALGADVVWSGGSQTVVINTDQTFTGNANNNTPRMRAYRRGRGTGAENYRNSRMMTLPTGTVIPVTLDETLSSNDNNVGDRFTATVVSGNDDAGLPSGTKVEGVIREAIPARNGKPGVLDVDFNRIVFPNGDSRQIEANLIPLKNAGIKRTDDGRLEATSSSNNNERWKWVGIGAGAGLLISTLTKGNTLVNTLLGAGAGYLYNELQRKGASNVILKPSTELGVRLDQQLAFRMNQ